ncbi:MAG TPA: ADOP family duplicated permease [Gemmatimonadales bacterium]|nr:ADOP family duplicated permease [Gemmatimonadales bacterium]
MRLLSDLTNGLRDLRRAPGFVAMAALCLALGIGVNAAMFQLVDVLFLRPPPHVEEPEELFQVGLERVFPGVGEFTQSSLTYPQLAALRESADRFAAGAYYRSRVSVGTGAEASSVRAELTAPGYFELLGVEPALGRWYTDEEARPGIVPDVAVLGHGFWRNRFGGDPEVLGEMLRIAGREHTVIGVAPRGFTGVELSAVDLWLPIGVRNRFYEPGWHERSDFWFLNVLVRPAPGVSPEQARAEAASIFRGVLEEQGQPSETFGDRVAALTPLAVTRGFRGPGGARGTDTVVWLAGVAGLVLLIACANVANLQIARGIRRRRDLAVRMALGAGRGSVVRQTLLESLAVAVLGAVAAGLVLFWVGGLFRGMFLPDVPPPLAVEQLRLAGFLAAGALVAGLLSGLAPALQAGRRDLTVEIRAGAPEGSARSSRLQGGLVAAQVALGLVLLVGTGLFVRSLGNAASLDLGFDAERVLVADVDLKGFDLSDEETARLYRRMAERAESFQGVVRTALAEAPPLEHQFALSISVPGREDFADLFDHGPYFHAVSEGYFKTMGVELLRGSGFQGIDFGGGGPRVVVVNEAFAQRVWPGQDPLGECMTIHEQTFCVTGVSENARQQGLIEEETAQVYLPVGHGPNFMGVGAVLVRTAGDPAEVAPLLQRELQTLRVGLPYVRVRPLEEIVAPQLASWRMGARLFGLYGALALVLAALGTYGVMAYTVARRTREMGVRIALGADRARVVRTVLQRGLVVTALGIAAGLGLVLLGGRFLEPLLFQIGPRDPAVLSPAAAVLGLSAALASYLPARRAARVDPVVALRAE